MLSSDKRAKLTDLLMLRCDGEIGQRQHAQLEALLLDDADAQDFYWRFLVVDFDLEWHLAHRSNFLPFEPDAKQEPGAQAGGLQAGAASTVKDCPTAGDQRRLDAVPASALPPTAHAFFPTNLAQFLNSPALSYVFAALLLAIAVVAAHRWGAPVDSREDAYTAASAEQTPDVEHRLPEARANPPATAVEECVATITAAGGCRWANPDTFEADLARGKIALAAGLMEITYQCGAKVILEGPATYVVDSPNGGFLMSGKLTGWTQRTKDPAGAKAAGAAASLPAPSGSVAATPPFTIRTGPVAVVDHGGATFGVWAERPTITSASVFRRSVDLDLPDGSTALTLREKEAARLEGTGNRMPLIVLFPANSAETFARQLPKAPPAYSIVIPGAKKQRGRSGGS